MTWLKVQNCSLSVRSMALLVHTLATRLCVSVSVYVSVSLSFSLCVLCEMKVKAWLFHCCKWAKDESRTPIQSVRKESFSLCICTRRKATFSTSEWKSKDPQERCFLPFLLSLSLSLLPSLPLSVQSWDWEAKATAKKGEHKCNSTFCRSSLGYKKVKSFFADPLMAL